jgi:hypothetical protein
MATVAQARRVFLEQPEAEEKSHMGHPDFRVGGKIFATLWPTKNIAVVRLSVADQTGALQMNPEAISEVLGQTLFRGGPPESRQSRYCVRWRRRRSWHGAETAAMKRVGSAGSARSMQEELVVEAPSPKSASLFRAHRRTRQ